jgi:hypothetical protein
MHEVCGIGIEMNQRYRSAAIHLHDEPLPQGALPADPILHHQVTTYPGSRIPHAWLDTRIPSLQKTSTIDLCGRESFVLLTGLGGEDWKVAAKMYMLKNGVRIKAYVVGWGGDWEDLYGDWERKREVEEDGALLVRPDRVVAWRSMGMLEGGLEACCAKLEEVMRAVLDGGPRGLEEGERGGDFQMDGTA